MQSFIITIRHISGARNTVADWLTRMYPELADKASFDRYHADRDEVSCMLLCMMGGWDVNNNYDFVAGSEDEDQEVTERFGGVSADQEYADALPDEQTGEQRTWTPEEMFAKLHGGRNFHMGARRTWLELNRLFPGHRIKYRKIAEMIMECPICQKERHDMSDKIEPLVRHIKPPHWRARVGVDNLGVTPPDEHGNEHLIVVVDQFSRYVWAMPAKTYDAKTIATALFVYFTLFGVFDELWSDPGSDLMSKAVKQLNAYLGIKHVVSLVDRHESNGVEGPNKQLLRHLRTLVYDERMIRRWSEPVILYMVLFVVNDTVHSETGFRPLDLKFGSDDGPYMRLPDNQLPENITESWLKDLDDDLRHLRSVSREHQKRIADERTAATPVRTQNVFQAGDLVLMEMDTDFPRKTKLTPFNSGPYEVVSQTTNVVHCKHLATGEMKLLHVSRLRMCYGTKEQGLEVALLDADRHVVRRILAWRGTVMERDCMWFYTEFEDGEKMWLPWSRDLDGAQAYGDFIFQEHPLYLLRFKAAAAPRERTALKRLPITEVRPGDVIFVDLRRWDECWYDQLNLPNAYSFKHVVKAVYTRWDLDKAKREVDNRIQVRVELFDENLIFDHYDVHCWGRVKIFDVNEMILVDVELIQQYPNILSDDVKKQQRLLKRLLPAAPRTVPEGGGRKVR